MSSELQSVVLSIVENNYVTLVILTAIGYDYFLTLSDEVEYVWNQPWTWVTTLFVLVRYFGLCGVTIFTLEGSSFFPGPAKGERLGVIGQWSMLLFIGGAELVMMLRVWVMYRRSRIVLGVLLLLYALQMVPFLIACILTSIKFTGVLDFSLCMEVPGSSVWADIGDSLQFTFAAVMFLLVVAIFLRHAFQVYTTSKRLRLGRYVSLLATEGILYFFAIFLYQLVNILVLGARISTAGWQALPIGILEYVPVFTLAPRFILSMRALYARDTRGRFNSSLYDAGATHVGIDSEFGLASGYASGSGVHGGRIVFATRSGVEEVEHEEIPMEERGMQGV